MDHNALENDVLKNRTPVHELLDGLKTADGLFAVDADQRIAYLNATAERILGCSSEDALGKPCYEVVSGRDSADDVFCREDCPIIMRAHAGEPTPAYDISVSKEDGARSWLNTCILLMESPVDGSPIVGHIIRDVTSDRHMQESARQAAEALRLNDRATDGVAGAHPRLSRRELDVLRLLTQGMSNNRIAEALYISPITARNHVDRIIVKFGVQSRLQAVIYASRHRLI